MQEGKTRSSTLTRQSNAGLDPLTMCRLTSSRSADSSKCAMSSVRQQETKVCREVSEDWPQDNVEEHLHGKVKTHADFSIKESVENRPLSVSTDMFASDVERRDMPRRSAQAKRLEWYRVRGERLKHTRKYLWKVSDEELGLTTGYSLTAKPLPHPSPMAESDPVRQVTTSNHPDLFKIICKTDVNTIEWLLTHHPNWGFIDSVLVGLHEGFWLFADMTKEGYLMISLSTQYKQKPLYFCISNISHQCGLITTHCTNAIPPAAHASLHDRSLMLHVQVTLFQYRAISLQPRSLPTV